MPEPVAAEALEEGAAVEDVEPALLTDEELDVRMSKLAEEDAAEEEAGEGAIAPEPAPAKPEPAAPASGGESSEGDGTEAGAAAAPQPGAEEEKSAEEVAAAGGGEQAPAADDDPTALKARIAQLESTNEELQTKADRTGNELGQLRTRVDGIPRQPGMSDEEFERLWQENPREAIRRENESLQAEAEYADVQKGIGRSQNQALIDKSVPKLQELLPEIGEILKGRGVSDQVVADLKANPYDFSAGEVIAFANEAKMSLRLNVLEIQREQEHRGKGDVAAKIEAAAQERPSVSAASGHAAIGGSSDLMSSGDIAEASDDALQEKLKKLKQRELG